VRTTLEPPLFARQSDELQNLSDLEDVAFQPFAPIDDRHGLGGNVQGLPEGGADLSNAPPRNVHIDGMDPVDHPHRFLGLRGGGRTNSRRLFEGFGHHSPSRLSGLLFPSRMSR